MTGRNPVGRRSAISIKMTAQELISRAVNTVQNRSDEVERSGEETPLEGVRYAHNEAMKAMLSEVYGYIIEANRLAVLRRQGCIAASAKRSLASRGRRLN